MTHLETIKQVYRVDRKEISFLRFLFEGYDGIAVIKTIDPQKGVILLYISPGCEDDVEMILKDLKKEIMIERLPLESLTPTDLEP
ncbi:MAG: DUF4911 domain-containing protein [Desulfobacterales bacterium]|nr:DUF4911 domain-containing protein [Desulfobacterales bacterium]